MNKIDKVKDIVLIISVILIVLIVTGIIISFPFLLSYLLSIVLATNDSYLTTGLSFNIFINILIITIPIIIFLLSSDKNNRINDIKKCFKSFKIFSITVVLVILALEIIFGYRGYQYFKDIKEGPKESIMMDVIVKRHSHKSGSTTYIIGYIDGKKETLEIITVRSKVPLNKEYKMVKVKYYDNIKEAYYIDVDINTDDK